MPSTSCSGSSTSGRRSRRGRSQAQGVYLDGRAEPPSPRCSSRGGRPLPEHIPFSPAAKKLLQLTLREALRMGHNYVGTEHVLLAVLGDDTPSAVVLSGLGVDHDAAEAWIIGAADGAVTAPAMARANCW